MRFSVRQIPRDGKPFGEYEYEIFDGTQVVARYWHDFRGDEHGIEFADGRAEEWPVGRMVDFLTGGGLSPLMLTAAAIAYLERRVVQD